MSPSNGTTNGHAIDVEKMATSPNSPDKIPDLLHQIASLGTDLAEDPQARVKLLEAARSLTFAVETPREAAIRHCWSQVCARGEVGTIPTDG